MKIYFEDRCKEKEGNPTGRSEWLEDELRKLEKLLGAQKDAFELEVHVKPDGVRQCEAQLILRDGKRKLLAKGHSDQSIEALSDAFKALRANVRKVLRKERKEFTRDKQQRQYEAYAQIAEDLAAARQESDREKFTEMLRQALPALKAYLKRRIQQAEKYRSLRLRAGSAADLVDELYLRLFDSYRLHIGSKEEFQTWLYREADRLLNDKLHQQEVDKGGEDIEALRKKERRSMEESFVVDAEGEYMMNEELDDPTYTFYLKSYVEQPHDFHFILDEEDKLLGSIEEDSDGRELDERINRILSKLPLLRQEIYELYYLEDLNTAQIALIKELEEAEVNGIIEEVREHIEREMLKG